MSDVWLAILNRFVEKYLNVKGGPTIVGMAPDLTMTLPVLIGVEERYHQGWSRFALAINITGGAGQLAALQLHNPLQSNTVAVVERIGVRSTAVASTSLFTMSFQPGPAGIADFSPLTPANLDGRSTVGSSMLLSSTTNGAGFAKAIWQGSQPNGIELQFIQTENQEFTLIPGSALILLDNTAADTGTFSIMWRERPLESSELT